MFNASLHSDRHLHHTHTHTHTHIVLSSRRALSAGSLLVVNFCPVVIEQRTAAFTRNKNGITLLFTTIDHVSLWAAIFRLTVRSYGTLTVCYRCVTTQMINTCPWRGQVLLVIVADNLISWNVLYNICRTNLIFLFYYVMCALSFGDFPSGSSLPSVYPRWVNRLPLGEL